MKKLRLILLLLILLGLGIPLYIKHWRETHSTTTIIETCEYPIVTEFWKNYSEEKIISNFKSTEIIEKAIKNYKLNELLNEETDILIKKIQSNIEIKKLPNPNHYAITFYAEEEIAAQQIACAIIQSGNEEMLQKYAHFRIKLTEQHIKKGKDLINSVESLASKLSLICRKTEIDFTTLKPGQTLKDILKENKPAEISDQNFQIFLKTKQKYDAAIRKRNSFFNTELSNSLVTSSLTILFRFHQYGYPHHVSSFLSARRK